MRPLDPEALEKFIHKASAEAQLVEVEVETPTVEAAAEAVGTSPDNIVKSLVFIVAGEAVLVIAGGNERVAVEVLAGELEVQPEQIRLAKPSEVLAATGYPVGAVPPFGHLEKLSALMDAALLDLDEVYAGGGASNYLLRTSPHEILRLSGANVIKLRT